jgi:metallo-beta-lactamase family protein
MSENKSGLPTGYSILSHGGIGDEHGEDKGREIPKHNLSWSCHELRVFFGTEVYRILIDIWGYQWMWALIRDLQETAKWAIAVILTHPHMDHIWELPVLFTENSWFEWRVFATPGTRQSAEVALIDAANIMAREYDKKNEGYISMLQEIANALFVLKPKKSGTKNIKRHQWNRMTQTGDSPNHKADIANAHETLKKFGVDTGSEVHYKNQMKQFAPKKPLYSLDDVMNALEHIELNTIKNAWKEIVPGKVAFRFYNAGHIIWSVSVLFRITQDRKNRYVLFSWDLWSYKWDFHPTWLPVPPHNVPIETVMIESTYGNRVRWDFAEWLREFENNLQIDLEEYWEVIITTFAMDRTQNILYRLIKMKKEWKIDADIILDSPAWTKHTMNYMQYAGQIDDTILAPHVPSIHKSLQKDFIEKESASLAEFAEYINPANGHYEIATKINRWTLFADSKKPKIVLTSSGMADGGMVVSHLEKKIDNPKKVFYFPGYLVPGTLGYDLANEHQVGWQQKLVMIWWKEYKVRATMKQFNFLSWHGDAEDLKNWLQAVKMRKDANILIVHWDIKWSSIDFANWLEESGNYTDKNIIVPWIWEINNFPLIEKEKITK